jgi:hypothetical protein
MSESFFRKDCKSIRKRGKLPLSQQVTQGNRTEAKHMESNHMVATARPNDFNTIQNE